MKKFTLLAMLTCILGSSSMTAQFLLKPTFFETLGISNDGVISGYEGQAGPYSIWNPDTQEFYEIGGAAPGQGVGGSAKFSANGAYLSGTNYIEQVISTELTRNVLADYNYIFKAVEFPDAQVNWGYTVGQSLTSNGNGIVLRTVNGGLTWHERWVDTENRGLEAMSFPTMYTGYVGGWNGYFAKTTDSGAEWSVQNPAGFDDVYIYKTITFKNENNGVVTAQLQENVGVYVTIDGGENWTTGTGLSGVPMKACYAGGDTYFLVTNGGDIQRSIDNGLTWTTMHTVTSSEILTGISFQNALTGIATGEGYIYKTIDGGVTWTEQFVMEGVLFRDAKWIDDLNVVLVGTPDIIMGSVDGGATWTWDNQVLFNGNPALYNIAVTNEAIHVCGSQGNFYRKSRISSRTVAEMSRYNTATDEWTALGNLGQVLDATTSAGFNISGDGNTVVGNSWANPENGNGYTGYAHGFVWNETEGNIDLGSMFANTNRSSRANAVNHDGSVIVGLQDFNGPWKSAVWRKNPAGGYFPNEYLLVDPAGSATNEYNQLGECSYVTPDGNWIGGEGDYANGNQPWIWSESTGVINLGDLSEGAGTGRVAGISPDGNMVVGWFSVFGWGATPIPFIWTPTAGIQNMNNYVTETMGLDLGNNVIYIPNNMSANGQFVTGFGVDPTIGNFGELFTFRLELTEPLAVNQFSSNSMDFYPNPVNNTLNINSAKKINLVEVYNMSGQLLVSESSQTSMNSVDMSSLSVGMYIVKAYADNSTTVQKVIKQ